MKSIAWLALAVIVIGNTALLDRVNAQADPACSDPVSFLAVPFANGWETYQAEMTADVNGLDAFWGQTMPEVWGRSFESPCVVEYDPVSVPYQASCGLTPEVATSNAFYCVPAHAVMWDDPNFYHPLYAELGDKALLYITAHEYGHAVQFLLGDMPQRSVNRELQADCYAGVYLREAVAQGDMTRDEASEVIIMVTAVGQSRIGSNWITRTHGTSAQRLVAVRAGYENGIPGCEVDLEQLAEEAGSWGDVAPPAGDYTFDTPNNGEVTITIPEGGGSATITNEAGEQIIVTPHPRPRPGRPGGLGN